MTQEQRQQSWWHTMPGMLTGAAAVITAVTGLFLAANQAGWLRRADDAEQSAAPQSSAPTEVAASKAASAPAGAAGTVAPSMSEVTLGSVVFTLLDVRTEVRNPETQGLRITVRFHNRGPYPANFWNANFRLVVDGIPRAPTGDLNKVVEGNSAQEGDVEFVFPVRAQTLALQIKQGEENAEIGLQR